MKMKISNNLFRLTLLGCGCYTALATDVPYASHVLRDQTVWLAGNDSAPVQGINGPAGVFSTDYQPSSRHSLGLVLDPVTRSLFMLGGLRIAPVGSNSTCTCVCVATFLTRYLTRYFLLDQRTGDLWQYDIDMGAWAFLTGTLGAGPGVYGPIAAFDAAYRPVSRMLRTY